ncbi:MAG: hypothetical protein JOY93_11525 [Acidobacteriales bacterium]|nr:hypothetical protein [Terriglobales bacterium]
MAQDDNSAPKIDIFAGYQWIHPGGTVPAPNQPFISPVPMQLHDIGKGGGVAGAYNFNNYLAFEADWGGDWNKYGNENTVSAGPRLMWRSNEGFNMFIHTLLGWNRLDVPGLESRNGIGAILGGGIDLKVNRLISVRIFEADYVWAKQNYGNILPVDSNLRHVELEGTRIRGGVLLNFGYPETLVPSATVTVQPAEVMTGEPVTATATATNFNAKHTLSYNWTTSCGKITGSDKTASIDTNGVPSSTCTVTVRITDPRKRKNNEASASASFTVKEPPKNPPTMTCSANPSSLAAGGTVNVTCTCTSPDNSQVTVGSWTASGGTISGSGNSATLNTAGASGTITVGATCTDARGLSTPASTQVTIEAPAPPAPAQSSKLSACDYPNPVKPWRVDNTCKAILDDVAQRLQHDADSRVVIVGNAEPSERRKNLAAERAVNAKAYLSGGEAKQGIDPSRIEVRTGNAGSKTAEFWIVPAGASYAGEGTEPVNESAVKAVPDHPAKKKPARSKKQQ